MVDCGRREEIQNDRDQINSSLSLIVNSHETTVALDSREGVPLQCSQTILATRW